jgi:hypothetical protein
MSELLRLVSPQKATSIFRYSRLALMKAIQGSNSLQVKAWNSRNADGQRLFRRAFEHAARLFVIRETGKYGWW